jgi:hypothetical protein
MEREQEENAAEKLDAYQAVDVYPMFGLSFFKWLLWQNVGLLGTSRSFAKVQQAYQVLGQMLHSSSCYGLSE